MSNARAIVKRFLTNIINKMVSNQNVSSFKWSCIFFIFFIRTLIIIRTTIVVKISKKKTTRIILKILFKI